MKEKTLGILGGVGPLATIYFEELVIQMTDAESDQEHIPMLVYNQAQIPDRTAYILDDRQPNPLPVMEADAKLLERCGCDYIVIPCNTAHYFYDDIQQCVNVPIINILEETVKYCKETIPSLRSIGVLATEGTVRSRAYQNIIEAHGLECILPDEAEQAVLTDIIYGQVKAGKPIDIYGLYRLIRSMKQRGADAVVLGCTELSIIKKDFNIDRYDVVDSMECLARASILACGKRLR